MDTPLFNDSGECENSGALPIPNFNPSAPQCYTPCPHGHPIDSYSGLESWRVYAADGINWDGKVPQWDNTTKSFIPISASSGVTSVGLSAPVSLFTVTGSPVTTIGTLGLSLITQKANFVFAGPTSGVSVAPSFRALVSGDIPDLSGIYIKRDGTTTLTGNWDAGAYNITQQANILSGTGGNGFLMMIYQSSSPVGTTGYTTLWADSSGRLNWRPDTGATSYIRIFDATGITANRTYTLPDVSTTLVGRSGSNISGYISFFSNTNQITSDSNLLWDNTNKVAAIATTTSSTDRLLIKAVTSGNALELTDRNDNIFAVFPDSNSAVAAVSPIVLQRTFAATGADTVTPIVNIGRTGLAQLGIGVVERTASTWDGVWIGGATTYTHLGMNVAGTYKPVITFFNSTNAHMQIGFNTSFVQQNIDSATQLRVILNGGMNIASIAGGIINNTNSAAIYATNTSGISGDLVLSARNIASANIYFATQNAYRGIITYAGLWRVGDNTAPTGILSVKGGSSTVPTVILDSATITTNALSGALEYNGDNFYLTESSTQRKSVAGVIYTQTTTKTVSNTVAETTLLNSAPTLPTNFFKAKKSLRITIRGYISSVAGPTIQIKAKLGTTVIMDSTAITLNNPTNGEFYFTGIITCYTTGATGTVWGQGESAQVGGGVARVDLPMQTTAAVTINTTTTQVADVTCTWGVAAAGNTITISNAIIEILD